MQAQQALQKLSQEHHDCYRFVDEITQIVALGSDAELSDAVSRVQAYYNDELELHFQHEEQTVFAPIFQHYREHILLATHLLKQHGYLRVLIQQMRPVNARQELAEFARLLKTHTELEEHELFPLIAEHFSAEQLQSVLAFKPLD